MMSTERETKPKMQENCPFVESLHLVVSKRNLPLAFVFVFAVNDLFVVCLNKVK